MSATTPAATGRPGTPIVEVREIGKSYGPVNALSGVST